MNDTLSSLLNFQDTRTPMVDRVAQHHLICPKLDASQKPPTSRTCRQQWQLHTTRSSARRAVLVRCNRGSETADVTGLVAAGAVSCTRSFLRVAVIERMQPGSVCAWLRTRYSLHKPRNLPDKSCTHRADEKRMVAVLVAGVSMGTPPIKGSPARGSPVTRCKARASTVFRPA